MCFTYEFVFHIHLTSEVKIDLWPDIIC